MRFAGGVRSVALVVAAAVIAVVPAARGQVAPLTLRPCAVQGISARCGTFVVPEDRAKPSGRQIGLRVVVLPALLKPAAQDAVAYLAGGPGVAATSTRYGQRSAIAGSTWPVARTARRRRRSI